MIIGGKIITIYVNKFYINFNIELKAGGGFGGT